jgi:hypothetical protein
MGRRRISWASFLHEAANLRDNGLRQVIYTCCISLRFTTPWPSRHVHLPDCHALLNAPVQYTTFGLLLAFHDENLQRFQQNLTRESLQDLIRFCRGVGDVLYFVVDQALKRDSPGMWRDGYRR